MIGNTVATDGEIGEMATPLFSEDLPLTTAVSSEPFGLGGHVTTQNVRNCHIMGGSVIHYYVLKSMVFEIFAIN